MLSENGFKVTQLPLYKTESAAASDHPLDPFQPNDIVFFASPSSVKAFAGIYTHRPVSATIGTTTARAAIEYGFNPVVAARPDLASICLAAGLNIAREENQWR